MAYPNLVAEMKRFKITTQEISDTLNRHPDTISNWLKGKSEISIGKAFIIQEKFFPTLSVKYLFSKNPITPLEERRE